MGSCEHKFPPGTGCGTRVALWWAWLVLKGTRKLKTEIYQTKENDDEQADEPHP
jgi:hypothetical protein